MGARDQVAGRDERLPGELANSCTAKSKVDTLMPSHQSSLSYQIPWLWVTKKGAR